MNKQFYDYNVARWLVRGWHTRLKNKTRVGVPVFDERLKNVNKVETLIKWNIIGSLQIFRVNFWLRKLSELWTDGFMIHMGKH